MKAIGAARDKRLVALDPNRTVVKTQGCPGLNWSRSGRQMAHYDRSCGPARFQCLDQTFGQRRERPWRVADKRPVSVLRNCLLATNARRSNHIHRPYFQIVIRMSVQRDDAADYQHDRRRNQIVAERKLLGPRVRRAQPTDQSAIP